MRWSRCREQKCWKLFRLSRMEVSGYNRRHRALFLVRTEQVAWSVIVCRYQEQVQRKEVALVQVVLTNLPNLSVGTRRRTLLLYAALPISADHLSVLCCTYNLYTLRSIDLIHRIHSESSLKARHTLFLACCTLRSLSLFIKDFRLSIGQHSRQSSSKCRITIGPSFIQSAALCISSQTQDPRNRNHLYD